MGLSFLPAEINAALGHVNLNFITEIRLRQGRPVIVGKGEKYFYLNPYGLCPRRDNAIICGELAPIVNAACGGSIYSYAEQIRAGFITCEHGVRIGLAGEYVTERDRVNTVTGFTSLNIRIPHCVKGCAEYICKKLFTGFPPSVLIFSKPGLGKTTQLRDIAGFLSGNGLNVLVFDERNEISATDGYGNGFDLGDFTDVVRAGNKLTAFESAIRAMKPDVIITDELYGEADFGAVGYAADCGIPVIASSHVIDPSKLKNLPFVYYVKLLSLFGQPVIYDKNFNPVCGCGADDLAGSYAVGGQKEENADIFGTVRV